MKARGNPAWNVAVACVAASVILAPMSDEPLAVAASLMSLALIFKFLWTRDEPPLLLLPAVMQWSQVALVPLSTLWQGGTMLQNSQYGGGDTAAAIYGLVGVTLFSFGLRLGALGSNRDRAFLQELRTECQVWPARTILQLAFGAIAVGYVATWAMGFGGSTRELFNQASSLRYAGFFLLTFWCLLTKQKHLLLTVTVLLDVVLGMTGFFADFMNTVLVVGIAAIAARSDPKLKDLGVLAAAGLLVVVSAVFWSSIKADYRDFVNQGTGEQVVTVSLSERLHYVGAKIADFDGEQFGKGLDRLVSRHGYIEFLGLTMHYVPEAVPHEYGKISFSAFEHILMPRLLFPWKPPLPSDTDVMVQYTGLANVWRSNTSISIGYLGELYVDFGLIGGVIAAGLFGFLVGRLYAIVRDYGRTPRLVNVCLCMFVLLPASYFGTALVKMFGALISSSLIAIFIQRGAVRKLLAKTLANTRPRPAPARQRT